MSYKVSGVCQELLLKMVNIKQYFNNIMPLQQRVKKVDEDFCLILKCFIMLLLLLVLLWFSQLGLVFFLVKCCYLDNILSHSICGLCQILSVAALIFQDSPLSLWKSEFPGILTCKRHYEQNTEVMQICEDLQRCVKMELVCFLDNQGVFG